MAVWTTAKARAAMVGAVLVALMVSSVSWFQARTTLSPVAARAGWGRPTVATRPTSQDEHQADDRGELAHLPPPFCSPTRSGATPPTGVASRAGTLAGARTGNARAGRVRACRSASKTLRTGSATGPARARSPARSYPQPGQWRQIT